jgi:hypothetical protein
VECNLGSIAEEADAVTADCCDGAGDDCNGGTSVAKTCDILCATRFVGFYECCGNIMKAMDEQRAAAFKSLYTTCKDGLPLGLLLNAVAECAGETLASLTLSGKAPGRTCARVYCGTNGACNDGICACSAGYHGPECEHYDVCFGINCGHGGCNESLANTVYSEVTTFTVLFHTMHSG